MNEASCMFTGTCKYNYSVSYSCSDIAKYCSLDFASFLSISLVTNVHKIPQYS